jgi:hypothetical protein
MGRLWMRGCGLPVPTLPVGSGGRVSVANRGGMAWRFLLALALVLAWTMTPQRLLLPLAVVVCDESTSQPSVTQG